jgi:hypothetical protein
MIQCYQLKQSESLNQAISEMPMAQYCHGEVFGTCQFRWIAGTNFKIDSPNFGEIFDLASEPPLREPFCVQLVCNSGGFGYTQ